MAEERKEQSGGVDNLPLIDEHEEEVHENGQKVRRRGVYLLPNLFTTAALFCGFYAIISAMNDQFVPAAVSIFVAMIFDGLDGRVARMTNTQSAFGAEYDSLSDMVSFGIAPALVSYCWALNDMGKFGWTAAFIFTACAALRLARFNTQIDTADKRFFTGFPSPAAASVVAGMVWAFADAGVDGETAQWVGILACLITAATGLLMVCNVRYHSFKQLDLRERVPFVAILAIVLVFAVALLDPALVLLGVFLLYVASGPVMEVTGIFLPADLKAEKKKAEVSGAVEQEESETKK